MDFYHVLQLKLVSLLSSSLLLLGLQSMVDILE